MVFVVVKVSALLSKLHYLYQEESFEGENSIWKLSTVLVFSQFEQVFLDSRKTFVSDFSWRAVNLLSTSPEKNCLRENNFVKNLYSFIFFGFWSETIRIFAANILQSCQNGILRVKQKKLIRGNFRGKLVFGITDFFSHQPLAVSRKLSDFQRKLFGKVFNTAFYVSWGQFWEKFFSRKVHPFIFFGLWAKNVCDFADQKSTVPSKLHSPCRGISLRNYLWNISIFSYFLDLKRKVGRLLAENFWQGCRHCEYE